MHMTRRSNVLVLLGLLVVLGPTILYVAFRSGGTATRVVRFRAPAVHVKPFTPANDGVGRIAVRLGVLSFDVPRADLVGASVSNLGTNAIELALDSTRVHVFVPQRMRDRSHLARFSVPNVPPPLASDEVNFRAAAYEARGQKDDEWTASSLFGKLDPRIARLSGWICDTATERIEIVRSPSIKGLLKFHARGPDGSFSGEFSYYSPDELTMGNLIFEGREGHEKSISVIRLLVGSLRLAESPALSVATPAQEVRQAVAAIQSQLSPATRIGKADITH